MEKVIIISCCLVALVCSDGVPSYIHVCTRNDPELNECAKNSVIALRDKLKSGMPELGIPSLEPVIIDEDLTLASSQAFSARSKNIRIYGIPDFDDLTIRADLPNGNIEIDVYHNHLRLEGDYDIMARILVPITAQGPIQIDAAGVTAKIVLKFKIVQHKGRDHMFFTSTNCKLSIRDYTSNYVPRAGQDRTFAEAINNVLNVSKHEILPAIISDLERGIGKKTIHVANSITKNFSYDELLPE